MSKHARGGTLVISLDLMGLGSESRSAVEEGALATIDTLLALLREAHMPATWASPSPAACPAVTEILAEQIEHEIALRLSGDQSGDGVRGIREIAQQVHAADRAGYSITTLLSDATPSSEALSNISRVGITGVSLASAPRAADASSWLRRLRSLFSRSIIEPPHARLLRYGLWEVPAAIRLPTGKAAVRRTLETASACEDLLHVRIDTPQVRRGRAGGLKLVEALVQAAFDLKKERRLQIRTIADVVAELRDECQSTPAQSILRRAA